MSRKTDMLKVLQKVLKHTGWKHYELAQAIGAPPTTLSRWLNGKHEISKTWQYMIENKLRKILKEIGYESRNPNFNS